MDDTFNLPVPRDEGSQPHPIRMSRHEVMLGLQEKIPLNDLGLPLFIHRPDLIPDDYPSLSQEEQSEILATSVIPLRYDEGFPTFDDGSLLWSRMEYEQQADYTLFEEYLNLTNSQGFRSVELLIPSPSNQGRPTPLDKGDLRRLFVFNYWGFRSRAWDMMATAAYTKIRERRAIASEDYHFLATDRMLKKALPILENMFDDEEQVGLMDPQDLLKIVKELIHLNRVAAGQPALTPSPPPSERAGLSTRAHLNKIAQSEQVKATDLANQSEETVEQILDDPDTAQLAQELMMRMLRKGRQQSKEGAKEEDNAQ